MNWHKRMPPMIQAISDASQVDHSHQPSASRATTWTTTMAMVVPRVLDAVRTSACCDLGECTTAGVLIR